MTSRNITTVRVTPDEETAFKAALKHYNVSTPAEFFRACMNSLVAQAKAGDLIQAGFQFKTVPKEEKHPWIPA